MGLLSAGGCLLWGAAATYCFFNAWLALLGMMACVIGCLRRRVAAAAFAALLFGQVTQAAVHGLGLVLLFAVCWHRLLWGRTRLEMTLFLVSAVCVMVCLLPTLPRRIDQLWESTNPGDTHHPD